MEMQQVRYFLALSNTLNFTRAAEECNVTQPALTRAIKTLEEELGGELLRRERQHSHLTELGRRMLPLLQQCYDAATSANAWSVCLHLISLDSRRLIKLPSKAERPLRRPSSGCPALPCPARSAQRPRG